MCDNGALFYLPLGEGALDVGFEPGGKGLQDLVVITQTVTLCHLGLVGIREERREPLDIVVWSLEQLGDGDGVMEARRQSQQHWLCVAGSSDFGAFIGTHLYGFLSIAPGCR